MNSAKVYHMTPLMQKHEDPLDLRGLPLVEPPRDGWPAVAAALQQDSRRQTQRRRLLFGLAAAASVVLALGLALNPSLEQPVDQAPNGPESTSPAPELAQQGTGTEAAATTAEAAAASGRTLDSLIAVSQGLEDRLRSLRIETGSLPADTVVYQAELEDLIVQVDERLSRQPDSLALWNQRVALMLDLEQLYEQGLRREYARMASL